MFYIYNRLIGPKRYYRFHKGYRCHHDTRYKKTPDAKSTFIKIPSKGVKKTECPFKLGEKTLKLSVTYSI